ncbi:MAG: hypothetical protein ACK5PR_00330, partial [bacterium]
MKAFIIITRVSENDNLMGFAASNHCRKVQLFEINFKAIMLGFLRHAASLAFIFRPKRNRPQR